MLSSICNIYFVDFFLHNIFTFCLWKLISDTIYRLSHWFWVEKNLWDPESDWCCSCAPTSVHATGPGPGQPAGRGLHQRPPAAQSRAAQDRGDGPPRRAALRHLPPAQGVARLRLQDPLPLPGDRIHPARSHRGQQAQGEGSGGRGCRGAGQVKIKETKSDSEMICTKY